MLTCGMRQGLAEVKEIHLNGKTAARIGCDPGLVPAPGQYLLAHTHPDDPLATPVFSAGACPGGFFMAPPIPANWLPGTHLYIRGPLGKGFQLRQTARFVALAAFGASCSRLLALVEPALAQRAALVLLTDHPPTDLPTAIEISPLAALAETLRWADTLLLDLPRSLLPEVLKQTAEAAYSGEAQALVSTPLTCGGMSECGVCAVTLRKGHRLACKEGPVFDLKTLGDF
jgi:hypothetical protein